ncbi:hypothetical protein ABFS82_02G074200 [Erythranthe guttata]|uniref:Uncharacterized protein n=1 Tax=Erythranthe guttata TaxID=4155 RepID=A0A022QFZ1_ERYGU|nr:PREDICTED: uncharacterized protein LOC105970112 [Erythranthe guttata]EYU26469.1 hypothetical protein MIMGU_mgv1a014990mg [Erythranthe guttata]|eukprot:XP_012850360.1 PREDICTED: uncharacterized protein LOC105970112 [Erythranthe guttata]
MSDQTFINGGRTKPWNMYITSSSTSSSSSNNPSPPLVSSSSQATRVTIKEAAADHNNNWTSLGSSMNAISFGFVATAILISMFLIMAIFEHLFGPDAEPGQDSGRGAHPRDAQKIPPPETVERITCASDYSVVMPGQKIPTFIAQPAPLPCPRETVLWPRHHQHTIIIDCP